MQSLSLATNEFNLPEVWDKAQYIDAWHELRGYRKDAKGNLISFFAYANVGHPYGWEVGHVIPKTEGGSDHIDNLLPVHRPPVGATAKPPVKETNPFAAAMASAGLADKKAI